jgi:CRISPR/Cas system CSM-associated protein Csm4 (group 5 of RAMP superfamily)
MNNFSKLWIFQSKRFLSSEERQDISYIISNFLKSWTAHGADLKSELKIIKNKFIIIAVDENQTKATGCSIDKLNQCIKQIDQKYQLDLLSRLWVSYEDDNGNIATVSMSSFKERIKSAQITPDTHIYNLAISTSKEFEEKFKQPLKESWAKIYM